MQSQLNNLPDRLEIGLTISLASAKTLSISSNNGSDDGSLDTWFFGGYFPVKVIFVCWFEILFFGLI